MARMLFVGCSVVLIGVPLLFVLLCCVCAELSLILALGGVLVHVTFVSHRLAFVPIPSATSVSSSGAAMDA